MGELRSFVEAYRSEVVEDLPDARLEEDFSELHRAVEGLETERLRRLAELDRRGVGARLGHLSTAGWLSSPFRMAFGAARALVRMARALRDMPRTRRALEEGDISMSGARVLVQGRETDPEAFRGAEDTLVEAARVHSTGDLVKVASYWRQAVEREALLDSEERLRERRRLHASTTFLGMVRVDGDLDPETGETLLTALRAVMDAETRSGQVDSRSAAQRRADALGEVCRQWLDHGDRPEVAGETPHLIALVDAEALRDGTGTSELDHTGPVDPELVRRMPATGGSPGW
jgi:Domain of unknown function (DUF222)